ncbi:MAG: DUF3800 domain-containing protein [Candidatus Aenigmarchaeota archaeon]|nr:DUF3800 domain-containing protein [Candidatus Aenigmarchaeota archaeon]
MYIFIDESGDLGFDFQKKGKPSDFFLVAALKIDDEKYLNRIIKRHRKRHKKKKEQKREVKFSNTSPENRRRILQDIAKLNVEIFIVYVDKHHAYGYIKDNPLRMYSYLLKILTEKCFYTSIDEQTKVVFDRSFSKIQQEALELYLITQNETLMKAKNNLIIKHLQSQEDQGLLCVDFVCGAAMEKVTGKNQAYYEIIEKKVKCLKKVY